MSRGTENIFQGVPKLIVGPKNILSRVSLKFRGASEIEGDSWDF